MIENITIELTGDEDKDFLNKNKEFFDKLNEQYNVFLKERDIAKKKWKTIPKKDFVPEQIKYSSPITIFNAPWGSGKTYFFEELIYNKLIEKINFKNYKFKEIYLIDLWEYIDEQNIAISILLDIIDKLLPKEKIKEKAIKYFKKGTSFLLNWFLNVLTAPNINLFNNEEKKNIGKIKNQLKKIDSTILIIDNLERMGDNSIEIIKIIQKLTYLNNLIIILPMDLDKLYLPANIQEKLGFMEKYITLGKYFEFKQDYYSLLCNKGIDKDFSKDLNFFIKENYNNQFLSIRDLKRLLSNKILDTKLINEACNYNIFYGLLYFNENVLKNKQADKWIRTKIGSYINTIWYYIYQFINQYKQLNEEIYLITIINNCLSEQVDDIIREFYKHNNTNIKEGFEYLYKNFLKFLKDESKITNHLNLFSKELNKLKDTKAQESADIVEKILNIVNQIDISFKELINKLNNDEIILNIFKNLYKNDKLSLDYIKWFSDALEPFLEYKLDEFIFELIKNKRFEKYE